MKRLTMSLLFRGKPLSYMRQGVDFTRRLDIGRDPALFWQVLDAGFPLRHTLVERIGDGFRLRTRGDWALSLSGKPMQGDVTLQPGQSGELTFHNDWTVRFGWDDVQRQAPTQAEMALRRQYARRPPLSAEQRFTRLFLLTALAVTATGVIIAQALSPEPLAQRNITDLVRDRQRAELVRAELAPSAPAPLPAPSESPAMLEETTTGERPLTSMDDLFGFNPNDVPGARVGDTAIGQNDLLEVNTSAAIVTTAGDGKRLGHSKAASWFDTRPGDADALFDRDDIGDLHTRDIAVGDDGVHLQRVDIDALTRSTTSFNIITLEAGGVVSPATRERFKGIEPVAEESVEVNAQTLAGRNDLAVLRQTVSTYRRQIETLFRAESAVSGMHGTLLVSLFIAADGTVQDARLAAAEGSAFSESFVRKARDLLHAWRLPVAQDTVYEFRMTFMQ